MAILISIKPEWVEKILSGEKTIEIRKTMPKCNFPQKVYIYCTKEKELWGDGTGNTWNGIAEDEDFEMALNYTPTLARLDGRIVAEFTLNNVILFDVPYPAYFKEVENLLKDVVTGSCLSLMKLHHYLKTHRGFGWCIEDLKIYEKPKLLQNFFRPCGKCDKLDTDRCTEEISPCNAKVIARPPQSWCYCQKVE